MASCALGELIPCAFVWHDPGITPCCKSPKLPGDKFPAIRRTNRRPPICVVSITLPKSPVSSSSGDEVPHIFTRKSRLRPGEFLVSSAKRLLQHNRHIAAQSQCGSMSAAADFASSSQHVRKGQRIAERRPSSRRCRRIGHCEGCGWQKLAVLPLSFPYR